MLTAAWDAVWGFFTLWFQTAWGMLGSTWGATQQVFTETGRTITSLWDGLLSFGTSMLFLPLFPAILWIVIAVVVIGVVFMLVGAIFLIPLFEPYFFDYIFEFMGMGVGLMSVYEGLLWPFEVPAELWAWFTGVLAYLCQLLSLPLDLFLVPFKILF